MTYRLEPPRLDHLGLIHLAGLSAHVSNSEHNPIPDLWTRFMPLVELIPNHKGKIVYGVVNDRKDEIGMAYLAAVEVESFDGISQNLVRQSLDPHSYAVFTHSGHIDSIRETWRKIWTDWVPNSDREIAEAPSFERYDERFNPATGDGEVEIWLPLRS